MAQFIETLENRMLLSATPLFTQDHAPLVHAAAHVSAAPKVSATVLQFTGFATDGAGAQTKLVVDISFNPNGDGSGLVVHTNSNGTTDSYTFKVSKTGQFTFGQTGADFTLRVQGQVSADHKSVMGNFMTTHLENGQTVSDNGTFLATLPAQPAPNPKTLTSGTHYTGMTTDSNGKTSTIALDIFKTSNGMTFGTVTHTNTKGVVDDTFVVKFDANGHFLYTSDNKTAGLKIEGQLSADKTAIMGNYTVPNGQGAVSTGTFTLNLA